MQSEGCVSCRRATFASGTSRKTLKPTHTPRPEAPNATIGANPNLPQTASFFTDVIFNDNGSRHVRSIWVALSP